jgi:hypothetical protein
MPATTKRTIATWVHIQNGLTRSTLRPPSRRYSRAMPGPDSALADGVAQLGRRLEGLRAEAAAVRELLDRAERALTPHAPGARAAIAPEPRRTAVEMALAGRSREDAGRHLRERFALEDPAPVLDDVFGAER